MQVGGKIFDAIITADQVIACTAKNDIVACFTPGFIITCLQINRVIARPANYHIIPRAGIDNVVARSIIAFGSELTEYIVIVIATAAIIARNSFFRH